MRARSIPAISARGLEALRPIALSDERDAQDLNYYLHNPKIISQP
jgi:hypothetical protein